MYCLGKINISFYGISNLSIYLSISFHIFFKSKAVKFGNSRVVTDGVIPRSYSSVCSETEVRLAVLSSNEIPSCFVLY